MSAAGTARSRGADPATATGGRVTGSVTVAPYAAAEPREPPVPLGEGGPRGEHAHGRARPGRRAGGEGRRMAAGRPLAVDGPAARARSRPAGDRAGARARFH